MSMLQRVAQSVAIILVLSVVAMPVTACIVADRQMTAEEHKCCEKMAPRCETEVMPSSHSCCRHPVSRHAVTAANIQSGDLGSTTPALTEAVSPVLRQVVQGAAIAVESPPESPPELINVLRI